MCSSIVKVIFIVCVFFSSSVFSQTGYFPGSTKDRLDDIEQQRMFDIRRQNEELQRRQPQINSPIYSNPQNTIIDNQYLNNTNKCTLQGEINCKNLNRICISNGATQWCSR